MPPADDRGADRALLGALGDALRAADDAPAEWVDDARSAWRWRSSEGAGAPVAALSFDSAVDPAPAGLTRSRAATRMLAFRSGDAGVDVELEVGPAAMVGQLSPGGEGCITVQAASGAEEVADVDEAGFFTLPPPPTGPVRLYAHTRSCTVVTSWVRLP